MELGIIGTSIWQQNMPLMERLTIDKSIRPERLEELKTKLGLRELIYLSTCNRVEFVYVKSSAKSERRTLHQLIDFFLCDNRDITFFPNDFYHFTGREAITHLFRTTAALESLVVGETQITGQFRAACKECLELGLSGPVLETLAKEALATARSVKRETSIGAGALSMASLAADELLSKLNVTDTPVIALTGSGEMTVKLARHIRRSVKAEFIFVNRTESKVVDIAGEFDGKVLALAEFVASPVPVDAIVSATSSSEPVFDADFGKRLASKDRPVICVDLAVPRDFSFDFSLAENVHVIDIPMLKSKGSGNLRQKFVEAGKANEIVRQRVNKFLANRMEVSLKPIFHDSYRESLALARQAFDDLFSNRVTNLRDEDKDAVLRLVTKLIGHSSFQPVRALSDCLVESKSDLKLSEFYATRKAAI